MPVLDLDARAMFSDRCVHVGGDLDEARDLMQGRPEIVGPTFRDRLEFRAQGSSVQPPRSGTRIAVDSLDPNARPGVRNAVVVGGRIRQFEAALLLEAERD